jgi:hypothetical protein
VADVDGGEEKHRRYPLSASGRRLDDHLARGAEAHLNCHRGLRIADSG